MRLLAIFVGLAALAQAPPQIVAGTVVSVAGNQLVVGMGPGGSLLLSADTHSEIWRGRTTNELSILQPGDQVIGRYRRDAAGQLVIINLSANADHITGRITKVAGDEFEVDQNYDADPHSAYRRQKREVTFNAETKFELSAPEDLAIGRDIDIIGVKLDTSRVQAARITVYEGKVPVRMPRGGRIVLPNGRVQDRN